MKKLSKLILLMTLSIVLNGCLSSDQGPQTPDGFINLATILADQSKIEDAIVAYQKIPYYFPENAERSALAEYKTGTLYKEYLSKNDSALHHYDIAISHYPQTIWAEESLIKKAEIYLATGEAGSARNCLERIITDYPHSTLREQAEILLQRARTNPY